MWRKLAVSGTEKVLLLAIADISNDQGDNIHPSNEYLEWMTDIPLRTIQYYKARWKASGALIAIENESGGAGNFVRYKLDLEPFPQKNDWKANAQKGAMVASFKKGAKGAMVAQKGAMVAQKGAMDGIAIRKNRERTVREPSAGESAPQKLDQGQRDTWDLRRWQEKMKELARGDFRQETDTEWQQRARQAAFDAAIAPVRIVELLKQHFPNDPNIDKLYDQKPLFNVESSVS